jgi:hypothetical protein
MDQGSPSNPKFEEVIANNTFPQSAEDSSSAFSWRRTAEMVTLKTGEKARLYTSPKV